NARSMPNRKLLFYNNIQTHPHSPGNFLPEPGQFFARRATSCPKEMLEKSGPRGKLKSTGFCEPITRNSIRK
ncbi:hypothetical protein, partial [Shewanella algae]|uniref:hypothetical protein n=1 Tax=Shewanella algae TaxID=38313 RepID=UPI0031F59731